MATESSSVPGVVVPAAGASETGEDDAGTPSGCDRAGDGALTVPGGSSEGWGTGHPDPSGAVADADTVEIGTDGMAPVTRTGAETESVTTVSPTRWLPGELDALRTGTGRVVTVGEGELSFPWEGEDEAVAGVGGVTEADGWRGEIVVRGPEARVSRGPGRVEGGAVLVVVGRDPTAGRPLEDGAGAGAAGEGAGRAMTGGAGGTWAGTERSELTT